jgi:hypothetical protein
MSTSFRRVPISIRGGALRLSEPRERHGARLPFDFFLRSLAEELGARAICVILSGTDRREPNNFFSGRLRARLRCRLVDSPTTSIL